MHARVNAFRVRHDRTDDAVRFFRDSAGDVAGLPGFRRALLLLDRVNGHGLTVTLWGDEAALRGSAERAAALFAGAAKFLEGPPERRDYEVALEVAGE